MKNSQLDNTKDRCRNLFDPSRNYRYIRDIFEYVQYMVSDLLFDMVDPYDEVDELGKNTAQKFLITNKQAFAISTAFTDYLFENSEGETQ